MNDLKIKAQMCLTVMITTLFNITFGQTWSLVLATFALLLLPHYLKLKNGD